jgi:hypothetical protein
MLVLVFLIVLLVMVVIVLVIVLVCHWCLLVGRAVVLAPRTM